MKEKIWRIGLQYIDEQELDVGKKIQDSEHYIWSEPIRADTSMKTLAFKQAFDDVPGIISYPLGGAPTPATATFKVGEPC